MILNYENKAPQIHPSVFIAAGVSIIGDVHIAADSSVWYNSVIRGDVAPVYVGRQVNIQDGTVIHTSRLNGPCTIGDRVTIGHLCLLHACNLHDDSFIGMGSIIMDNVIIESYAFVAAGSLVTPGKVIKSKELWAGRPAKFVRYIGDDERFLITDTTSHYMMLASKHKLSTIVT